MKITLDAMGGDNAPAAAVEGAVWAARDFGITVQLVGRPEEIEAELSKHNTSGLDLPILPASQVIEMGEPPAKAVKNKKDSSMVVGLRGLKAGECDAFVSAGNSGGVLASALFGLGRIHGIKRPALSTIFPNNSKYGHCFLLDVGANTDVRPEYLLQFGLMGSIYAERVMGISTPRVALLSTGEEEDKGSQLIKETTPMFKATHLNFIGNVEGRDIPTGRADVIVTDGFTGNVLIKGVEGAAFFIMRILKQEIKSRPLAWVGAALAWGALQALKKKLDYREFGGILLGVNGVVIIAHGSADAYSIRNAIRTAKQAAENNIVHAIESGLSEL